MNIDEILQAYRDLSVVEENNKYWLDSDSTEDEIKKHIDYDKYYTDKPNTYNYLLNQLKMCFSNGFKVIVESNQVIHFFDDVVSCKYEFTSKKYHFRDMFIKQHKQADVNIDEFSNYVTRVQASHNLIHSLITQ